MEPGTSAVDKCFHFSPSLLTLQCSSELSQLLGFVHVTAPREAEMIQPGTLSLWGCSAFPSHGQAALTLCWPARVEQQVLQPELHRAGSTVPRELVTLPAANAAVPAVVLQGRGWLRRCRQPGNSTGLSACPHGFILINGFGLMGFLSCIGQVGWSFCLLL